MRHLPTTLCAAALLAATSDLPAQLASLTTTGGVDGYCDVPYTPDLVPQTGITVEAWINYDHSTIPSGWQYPTICRQGLLAGEESYFLRINGDASANTVLRWLCVTTAGNVDCRWSFASSPLVGWKHVAATYDGAMASLYVDGQQVAQATGTGAPLRDYLAVNGPSSGSVPSDYHLNIGRGSHVGGIEVFNGSIDEFRLWPYARTQAEIVSTRDFQLIACPGGVSTWSLDNDFFDSSDGRHGSGVGTYTFGAPAPTNVGFLGGSNAGAPTNGCLGDIRQGMTSLFEAGNLAFALIATNIPPSANTVCQFSFVGVLPSPINIVGFDLWIDLSATTSVTAMPAGLDTMRLNFGITQGTSSGVRIGTQFISIDPCGPMSVTASEALSLTTL